MSPSEFLRWSGLAAVLGGVLFSAKILWEMAGVVPLNTTDITDTLFFIVPLLWLAGLSGFYARCTERYGPLGNTGFMLSLAGLTVGTIGSLVGAWIEPLWLAYWLGFRFLCLGLVLLGIATIGARALPRGWSVLPLVLGLLGLGRAFFMFFAVTRGATLFEAPEGQGELGSFLASWAGTLTSVLGVLFGIGWTLLGYALWVGKTEETERSPARVR
jgi:hypothetical protein